MRNARGRAAGAGGGVAIDVDERTGGGIDDGDAQAGGGADKEQGTVARQGHGAWILASGCAHRVFDGDAGVTARAHLEAAVHRHVPPQHRVFPAVAQEDALAVRAKQHLLGVKWHMHPGDLFVGLGIEHDGVVGVAQGDHQVAARGVERAPPW